MPHSQTIRLERHERIGHLIQNQASMLIDRWAGRALEEHPEAQRVHHEVLLDHLPAFLRVLGRSLGDSDKEKLVEHRIPAIQHGEQRWQNGWSLPELIRDYQLLRTVTFEYLDEHLGRPLLPREILAINLAFDEAIAASVGMYIAGRDEAVRQAERERVERERQAEAEWLRRQAEALKEVNRRKDDFLAVLGHELRNPLAPLRNAVKILALKGDDPVVVAEMRSMIERQATQMARLVDELLDAARIAQGKVQLKRERLDLAALVRTVTGDHRAELVAAGLTLAVEVPEAPVWLQADAERLTQVLGNLLHNTLKFTDPGERVTVRLTEKEGRAVLEVEDTGVGIAPEALSKLFEAFGQLDATLNRSKGGLGLGLSVVKGLVELHGGNVHAASAGPGRGATFTVWLSLDAAPRQAATPAAAELLLGTARPKVLIIEDNRDAADSLQTLLSLQGFEAVVARSGADGVEQARHFQPDAIVCDLGMPGMSGFEVARALRADPATAAALLVCVSGYGQEQDQQQARAAGFDQVMVKPVDHDVLVRLLARPRPLER